MTKFCPNMRCPVLNSVGKKYCNNCGTVFHRVFFNLKLYDRKLEILRNPKKLAPEPEPKPFVPEPLPKRPTLLHKHLEPVLEIVKYTLEHEYGLIGEIKQKIYNGSRDLVLTFTDGSLYIQTVVEYNVLITGDLKTVATMVITNILNEWERFKKKKCANFTHMEMDVINLGPKINGCI